MTTPLRIHVADPDPEKWIAELPEETELDHYNLSLISQHGMVHGRTFLGHLDQDCPYVLYAMGCFKRHNDLPNWDIDAMRRGD
jgi:hypothetical protein